MDTACLQHLLSQQERREFEEQGCFLIEDALPPAMLEQLTAALDRIDAQARREEDLGPHHRLNLHDAIGKDERFLELIDWPTTFPKVWGILGWNIQLYHTQIIVTPTWPPDRPLPTMRGGWHQDNNRMNQELETPLQPRVSLKVAYFLTDTSEPGRGNLYIVPGSHLQRKLEYAGEDALHPVGAEPVRARPGAALFFDRRLWHAASPNTSAISRKVLFYGYSYRWLRPKCEMDVGHLLPRCDPIRRQLLGVSSGAGAYFEPRDEDVPLRGWLETHLGKEAVAS